MLPLLGLFAAAFVVALSGAMMPGPLLAATVDEGIRRGARAGPLLILGHMLLESALVAAVALGLASFLRHPMVIGTVGLAGGATLCWMGVGMLSSARTLTLKAQSVPRRRLHPIAAGIVVSLSNPYWTIWWATVGLGYLLVGLRLGWPGIAAFFSGHILADFAWYTLVSTGVARGRRFLTDRAYRGLILMCGLVLVGFGVWFLWSGLSALGGR